MYSLSRFLSVCFFAFALALTGCGAGGGGGADDVGNEDAPKGPEYTVDATDGDDANPGTPDLPLRTISKALDLVAPGETVRVRSGVYDEALGERFPLRIPREVTLLGNTRFLFLGGSPGRGVVIDGSDFVPDIGGANRIYASVLPGPDSTISGFTIINDEPRTGSTDRAVGVAAAFSGASITGCTIRDADSGIRCLNTATELLIDRCHVKACEIGLVFANGGMSSVVQRNTITENRGGVFYGTPGADLGGGLEDSLGQNVLARNEQYDVANEGATVIFARDNFWDHVPPEFHRGSQNVPAGIDIWFIQLALMPTEGARHFDDSGPVLGGTLERAP